MTKREIVEKFQANRDRMREIAEACEREQRERTEAESKEFEALRRDNEVLQMRMAAGEEPAPQERDLTAVVRENIGMGRRTEMTCVRANVTHVVTNDVKNSGIIPVKVQEILEPLEEGLILDKVGLPLMAGLAGDYVWPTYEAVEATVLNEGVALSDTTLTLDKLTAQPQRIGVAIPVTRETINQTEGVVEDIIRKVMPASVTRLVNKILFSTEKVNNTTPLVGPFAKIAQADIVSLSAVPTFAELNGMKAKVLESGIDGEHLCWVMTKSQKAILEGTPVNSDGIYRPLVENDTLCGLPIFTTNYIRKTTTSGDTTTVTEFIGLGDWRYQPMGLFGDINFIVDPYSKARNNAVDFVLNVNYGTVTLRPEAFALGQVGA